MTEVEAHILKHGQYKFFKMVVDVASGKNHT